MCQDREKTVFSYKFEMLSVFQGETETQKKGSVDLGQQDLILQDEHSSS
jgi:hypothetical protein